ncbi:MAG: ABC transporter ATP-binding protein [Anaerolineae bacterium]|nr:ABC transporter ATP-binding protein [Thermoflexales bacterium]MDW8396375.1 ABC transporter ATP-binding protein [Anaerolineae bacterium]
MPTPPLLELRQVSKVYARGLLAREQVVALNKVSLTIDDQRPSIIAVAGESGSGKTTLGSLVLGFIQPTTGAVLYRGQDVARLNGAAYLRFRREVQAVFQDPFAVFNPFYRVDHLLETPIAKFKLARSKREARRMMEDALNAVGLRPEEILGRFPHQLSGGQRQRITIARALLLKPRLLVADEPVSMVDASLRATILESLRRMRDEHGISILYITHDLTTAYHVSDDILVLYAGNVVEAGDAEQVIRQPKHPYTQLLIDSIPWPEVDRRWGSVELVQRDGAAASGGCRFFARCPAAMPRCAQSAPALYRVSEAQAAACYLHEGQPVALDEVLRASDRAVMA